MQYLITYQKKQQNKIENKNKVLLIPFTQRTTGKEQVATAKGPPAVACKEVQLIII